MRTMLFLIALLMGAMLIVGSSGNFRAYTANRSAVVGIVSGENSYVAYHCLDSPVSINAGEGVDFIAITVQNLMDRPISVHVEADFSNLPSGVTGDIDGSEKTIDPGESAGFGASIESDEYAEGGLYEVPITIYADWDGGSAVIEACSLVVQISAQELIITKTLISGNRSFPVNTPQEWVMEIKFRNNGEDDEFLISDFVDPVFFKIDSIEISKGRLYDWTHYEVTGVVLWGVNVTHGETVTMRIHVSNVMWCFPCFGYIYSTNMPGEYTLNCGACVMKMPSREHCCGDHDWNHWESCGCGHHDSGCGHHNDHNCPVCLVTSNGITVEAYTGGGG
ncbi:hypothetical protein [Thermococcus sp. 21S7]|uniref:COG1470 family protein n=1 Tax=Thermococcus sp. 21S7 TaxID=1638221 RepID=UPI00143BCB74|nr:hypothetical protein [Thermococcus sp. 21S7]NJE62016.1 hypothetical protein [Thermococcus sp. 21S7]